MSIIFGIIVPQLAFVVILAVISAMSLQNSAYPYLFAFHLALTFLIAPIFAAFVSYHLARRPSLLLKVFEDANDLYTPRTRRSSMISSALSWLFTFLIGNVCLSTWLLRVPWSITEL